LEPPLNFMTPHAERPTTTAAALSRLAVVLLLILAGASGVHAQQGGAAAARAAASDAVEQEYLVGPGDVLEVVVWKETDLSKDVTVRLDGRITVPLLGDVDAAGRTPQRLAEEIASRLAKFIATPQVTVGVTTAGSSRFYVIGMVANSGEYKFTGRTTVVQALALAGGFQQFAKTDSIVIIRRVKGVQTFLPVNYKRLAEARDASQNIFISPGDTILVP
jgi:polysaccharide biosynthesis/export protein